MLSSFPTFSNSWTRQTRRLWSMRSLLSIYSVNTSKRLYSAIWMISSECCWGSLPPRTPPTVQNSLHSNALVLWRSPVNRRSSPTWTKSILAWRPWRHSHWPSKIPSSYLRATKRWAKLYPIACPKSNMGRWTAVSKTRSTLKWPR